MQFAEVTLPGGFSVDGVWHRGARLRPPVGSDEAFFAEEAAALSPAARSSELLARCLTRLGPLAPVDRAAVCRLAVGDREALFLHLRRLTFGELIACVQICPEPSCRAKMDLELTVSELLQPCYPQPAEVHETVIRCGGAEYGVRFRLPNGDDLEATASVAAVDAGTAAGLIFERTIQRITEINCGHSPEAAPPELRTALSDKMAELDPQAEMLLNLRCPECAHCFQVIFDASRYFEQELSAQREELFREVHALAFHYHWSESEILAMSARKRRLYLGLLAEELSERRRA